jgi:hypothetical protein
MKEKPIYAGFYDDSHGITMLGRVVLDGWLFGLIPETEDCKGWDLTRMQTLMYKIEAIWDEYGNLPSRLPPELLERHTQLYRDATERGRERGWNPELDDES